jgi:regulator of sigma E protease
MTILISIVAFLVIIILLILVHEFGHYITAKVSDVKVEEFGLGLPPRIWGFQKGETLYSINWIPLGGFCRMAGEEDPDVPRSLASKNIKTRLIVLSAGSVFMLLFPLFLLPAAYMTPMERIDDDAGVWIKSVDEGSPAEDAGLQVGDIFIKVNGQEVYDFDEMDNIVDANRGSYVTLLLDRNGIEIEETVYARTVNETPEGRGSLGVFRSYFTENGSYVPWEAVPKGLGEYGEIMVAMKDAWGMLFSGEVAFKDAFAGPIGIAQMTGEIAGLGIDPLIRLAVIISVTLGIVNLLPVPGLDGGRLVFVIIEGIRRGKRISPKKEGMIHLIGFLSLLAFVIWVSQNDIARLLSGGSFLP